MAAGFGNVSMASPIYQTPLNFENICAAFTGKGISARNSYFSFHRPSSDLSRGSNQVFITNLQHLAQELDFDPQKLTWPNGAWPHSGQVIKAEEYRWVNNPCTGGLMPVTDDNEPVAYDGIATRSREYVLGVQGADCPSVFLYDPNSGVIGLVHAGWRPVVRRAMENVVRAMEELGACARDVFAYISPGIGDRYNEFHWDTDMEPRIKAVFLEAGREDLLKTQSLRHEMTKKDQMELAIALGREMHRGISFKLSTLLAVELEYCGLHRKNISHTPNSTITDRYKIAGTDIQAPFRYHSFRRERPNHGLSISIIFLKPKSSP